MSFQKLVPVSKLEEGKIFPVETKFLRVGLLLSEGKVYAFEDVCTHDGGEISSGTAKKCIVTCERHGASFDVRDGKVVELPATEPLPVFPVRIIDGFVEVDLEA